MCLLTIQPERSTIVSSRSPEAKVRVIRSHIQSRTVSHQDEKEGHSRPIAPPAHCFVDPRMSGAAKASMEAGSLQRPDAYGDNEPFCRPTVDDKHKLRIAFFLPLQRALRSHRHRDPLWIDHRAIDVDDGRQAMFLQRRAEADAVSGDPRPRPARETSKYAPRTAETATRTWPSGDRTRWRWGRRRWRRGMSC